MHELAARLPVPLWTFEDLGWTAQGLTDTTREAAAFAFLGYARAQGWSNTLPHTTGARHAVSGGKHLLPHLFRSDQHDHRIPPDRRPPAHRGL
ncbi:hypothetical protein ACFSC4_25010 [Deinococcus malanensis]|uniref:hypothetical protein n=1 Tax=Deinococcus malanensis TaxID=1706855 RepID=UPI0036293B2B